VFVLVAQSATKPSRWGWSGDHVTVTIDAAGLTAGPYTVTVYGYERLYNSADAIVTVNALPAHGKVFVLVGTVLLTGSPADGGLGDHVTGSTFGGRSFSPSYHNLPFTDMNGCTRTLLML
jgi:hypothetical protein